MSRILFTLILCSMIFIFIANTVDPSIWICRRKPTEYEVLVNRDDNKSKCCRRGIYYTAIGTYCFIVMAAIIALNLYSMSALHSTVYTNFIALFGICLICQFALVLFLIPTAVC